MQTIMLICSGVVKQLSESGKAKGMTTHLSVMCCGEIPYCVSVTFSCSFTKEKYTVNTFVLSHA